MAKNNNNLIIGVIVVVVILVLLGGLGIGYRGYGMMGGFSPLFMLINLIFSILIIILIIFGIYWLIKHVDIKGVTIK